MYCDRCGAQIKEGQRFCPSCGLPLEQTRPAQDTPSDTPPVMTQPGMKQEYAQRPYDPYNEEQTVRAQQPYEQQRTQQPYAQQYTQQQFAQPGMKREYAQQPYGQQPYAQQPYTQQPNVKPEMTQPGMKQEYVQPSPKEPAPKKKLNPGLLIGLIGGGVVLIAAIVVLLVLHPWSKAKEETETGAEVFSPVETQSEAEATAKPQATPKSQAQAPAPVPAATPAPTLEPREEQAAVPVIVYDIDVWVGEAAVSLTVEQIATFNETNEYGIRFHANVNGVSEGMAGEEMLANVSSGADIYCFAQDQLARLVQGGALSKLNQTASGSVRAANDAGSVKAASIDNTLYAYPMTADNGYFMYYDKSVIPEKDVDSLEKLIADCEASGRQFAFECETSAWYLASWFFATGCVSEWTTDDRGSFISVKDTFNSPEGLIAVKGMKKLLNSSCYLSSSNGDEFANKAAIVVTGTWNRDAVKKILGDRMGVADLPSFTVDGKTYHLGSFNGCKLVGVKPQNDAKRQDALHKLAQYLTGEPCQQERFNELRWGPSNLNVQQSGVVQSDPALAALLEQNQYAVPQGQIHGAWWDIAKTIAGDVKTAKNEQDLKKALENYYNKIAALFEIWDDSTAHIWGVIGSICGTFWDTDFPMTEIEPGVFRTEPLNLQAYEEFKVRQDMSWEVNYGANGEQNGMNIVVEKSGTYYVWFNSATGDIWLESY